MEGISLLSVTRPLQTKLICLKAFCCLNNSSSKASARKILKDYKRYGSFKKVDNHKDCASIIQTLSIWGLPHIANELVLELQSKGFLHDNSTLSALMLCYANNGLFAQADAIWHEVINSSYTLDSQLVSDLIDAYVRMGLFDEVNRIVRQVGFRHPQLLHKVYAHTISCYGKIGELDLMENTLKDMVSKGFPVDSAIDRRLGRNLDFALRKMNVKDSAVVLTDEAVFDVLGKGDFHSSSEALLEFSKRKTLTYKELIAMYLKKKYRSNQVFWNY